MTRIRARLERLERDLLRVTPPSPTGQLTPTHAQLAERIARLREAAAAGDADAAERLERVDVLLAKARERMERAERRGNT